jgi:type 1 glutamine amidotransferase
MVGRTKLNGVILTGSSEHDWLRTSLICCEYLTELDFHVEIAENPDEFLIKNRDSMDLLNFFVVCYNGVRWSPEAERIFENVVKDGAGVIIVHSSNNGFKGWEAMETMCGLMWRRQNELVDGNVIKTGSGHSEIHSFDIEITLDHPAAEGIPKILKNHTDELYHNLRQMHNANFSVLAEAYSDPKYGGTGKSVPVVLVSNFGKGRIWHTTLGHIWPGETDLSLRTETFKTLFTRGSLWAAKSAK